MKQKTKLDDEKGIVLVMLLIYTAVLLLLGSFYLNHVITELHISSNFEENIRAYYAAEAGIEMGFALLNENFYFESEGLNIFEEIGEGCYEVFIGEIIEGERQITSKSYINNARGIIKVTVTEAGLPETGAVVKTWLKPD